MSLETRVRVYLGLGSNLGDREASIQRALELLGGSVEIEKTSQLYETEPWGYAPQPKFLNAVCQGTTRLDPWALLATVKDVEWALGRTPGLRYGPRTIDVDILFYGQETLHYPDLTIPHPRIAERAFVLVPLAEIAPDLVHPLLKKSIRRLLGAVEGKELVRRWKGKPSG